MACSQKHNSQEPDNCLCSDIYQIVYKCVGFLHIKVSAGQPIRGLEFISLSQIKGDYNFNKSIICKSL